MRVGRLILGSAVLGAVGTYVYKNASDENKKKLLNYVKKAVDWLPSSVRGYIPQSILNKLEGDNSSSTVGKSSTESGSRASSTGNTGGSQSKGNTGFTSAGSR